MPATGAEFDQIRHILGKLDRSIDQARSRRLHADGGDRVVQPSRPEPGQPQGPNAEPARETPSGTHSPRPQPDHARAAPTPTPAPAPLSENARLYGRAKPIRSSSIGLSNPEGSASKAG